ncbi:hypothetical protein Pth03_49790 [Planotetraspora thailandica]|uniref:HTH arsR-type domain-containing protein n=1 Tax=Planotetraspora thailandica TaxID=487172 RepID=A0A8J3V5U0_9ACTN|nr:hypothetical protein Pth03_49790 [Planotetraspora thailandica]
MTHASSGRRVTANIRCCPPGHPDIRRSSRHPGQKVPGSAQRLVEFAHDAAEASCAGEGGGQHQPDRLLRRAMGDLWQQKYSACTLNIDNVNIQRDGWEMVDESGRHEDAYEAVFSALAHPARRRVLLTIYFNGGSMAAGEIAAVFSHAWQTTTRHLQILEAAGLLSSARDGRMRIYHLERKRLDLVRDWLAHFSITPDPTKEAP